MNSNGGEPHPDNLLQTQLDTARAALLDSVQHVRARGGPDASGLIPAAREIQRLTESLIAELVRCASNTPGGAPIETLLGADGTVPRHQVRTEIEGARVALQVFRDRRRCTAPETGPIPKRRGASLHHPSASNIR